MFYFTALHLLATRLLNFIIAKAVYFVALLLFVTVNAATAVETGCKASAQLAYLGCSFSTKDDLFSDRAKCQDSTEESVTDCFAEAEEVFDENQEECEEVLGARIELCEELNDAPHEPAFGPEYAENFVDPMQIGISVTPNPYFPLTQGNSWVYEGTFEEDGEEITEQITITVTSRTKLIDGITCLVVRDVVFKNDELVEDTDDWFAQDTAGNLWYCGEEVKDYETFEGDVPQEPEMISDDGSFKAGRGGDEAGISLPGTAVVGDVFRQEMSISNAEDVIEIIATDANETSPAAVCNNNCLMTRDLSPMDPGVEERKFYLPGVGRIVEYDLDDPDARIELIEYTVN